MSDFICIPILHSSQGARVRKSSVDAVVPQSDGNTLVVCGAESWLSTMTCDEITSLIEGPPPSQTDCESRQLRRPGCIVTAEYERMCWRRFATFDEFASWAKRIKHVRIKVGDHVESCVFRGVVPHSTGGWFGLWPDGFERAQFWDPDSEYCSSAEVVVTERDSGTRTTVTPTDDGWRRFATFGQFVEWAEKVTRINCRSYTGANIYSREFVRVLGEYRNTWEGRMENGLLSSHAWTPEAEYSPNVLAANEQQTVTTTDEGWRTFATFDEFCEWAKGKTFEARHYGDNVRATQHTFSRSTNVAPYWRDSAGTIWCCHPIHSYREVKP